MDRKVKRKANMFQFQTKHNYCHQWQRKKFVIQSKGWYQLNNIFIVENLHIQCIGSHDLLYLQQWDWYPVLQLGCLAGTQRCHSCRRGRDMLRGKNWKIKSAYGIREESLNADLRLENLFQQNGHTVQRCSVAKIKPWLSPSNLQIYFAAH